MKVISNPKNLLQTFVGLLKSPYLPDIVLQVNQAHSDPVFNVKVRNRKAQFPILPELHPSRKILERPKAAKTKPVLILCPHIPEDLAKDLRQNGINHADLNGRLFLKTPNLILDREPRDKTYRGPGVEADLFSLKTSRIIRSLLSHPGRLWTQAGLASATKTSPGLVSRIVNALLREGYIRKDGQTEWPAPATYSLKESDRLLNAWQHSDNWKKRVQIQAYSILKNDPLEIAEAVQKALGPDTVVFTQWLAGFLRFPYTTPTVVTAYYRESSFPDIPFARKVTSGGNLWIILPKDEGVFLETRIEKGLPLVCDSQIYLDLLQVGQRGPDQAEALRKWEGFNQ